MKFLYIELVLLINISITNIQPITASHGDVEVGPHDHHDGGSGGFVGNLMSKVSKLLPRIESKPVGTGSIHPSPTIDHYNVDLPWVGGGESADWADELVIDPSQSTNYQHNSLDESEAYSNPQENYDYNDKKNSTPGNNIPEAVSYIQAFYDSNQNQPQKSNTPANAGINAKDTIHRTEDRHSNSGKNSDNSGSGYDSLGQGYDTPDQSYANPGQGYDNPGQGYDNSGQGYDNTDQAYSNSGYDYNSKQGYGSFDQDYHSLGRGYDNSGHANPDQGYDKYGKGYDAPGKGTVNSGQSLANLDQGDDNPGKGYENSRPQYRKPHDISIKSVDSQDYKDQSKNGLSFNVIKDRTPNSLNLDQDHTNNGQGNVGSSMPAVGSRGWSVREKYDIGSDYIIVNVKKPPPYDLNTKYVSETEKHKERPGGGYVTYHVVSPPRTVEKRSKNRRPK